MAGRSTQALCIISIAALLCTYTCGEIEDTRVTMNSSADATTTSSSSSDVFALSSSIPRSRFLPLTTAPTRIAFGSCNKQFKPQPFWDVIRDRNPDIFIWLGDIIYADTPVFLKYRLPGDPLAISRGYTQQLENPGYRRFVENVPMIAGIWDDHDFGTNDGDKTVNASWKEASQSLLLDFLNEPLDSPRRKQHGVYTSYKFGGGDASTTTTTSGRGGGESAKSSGPPSPSVYLILLDNRYNRDPYTTTWYSTPHPTGGIEQDMLGDEQWEWLDEELTKAEESSIVLIGSGLQIISRGDPWIAESYSKLPQSKAKLISMLAAHKIRRPIFLTGDVHLSELHRVQCDCSSRNSSNIGRKQNTKSTTTRAGDNDDDGGNNERIPSSSSSFNFPPLYDFTSSGMTHSWNGAFKRAIVALSLMGTTRVVDATSPVWNGWYNERNWGEIEIHWGKNPTDEKEGDDRTITLRVWGVENTVVLEKVIPFSEFEGAYGGSRSDDEDHQTRDTNNNDDDNVDDTAYQAALICAKAPLNKGLTPECARVLAGCSPQPTWFDSVWYFGGHFILVGGGVSCIGLVLFSPLYFIYWFAPLYLPGGKPVALAVVIAVLASIWGFIESLH